MTLETTNCLEESRTHLPEVQKSAKATRNGQNKVPPPRKKKKTGTLRGRKSHPPTAPDHVQQSGCWSTLGRSLSVPTRRTCPARRFSLESSCS